MSTTTDARRAYRLLASLAAVLSAVVLASCSSDAQHESSAASARNRTTALGETSVAEAFADTQPDDVDRYVAAVHRAGGQFTAAMDFSDTGLTDDDLAALELPQSITSLNLARTKITDDGVAHLKKWPQLTTLDLSSNALTDATIDHLIALPNLQHAIFHHPNFSQEKSAELLKVIREHRRRN